MIKGVKQKMSAERKRQNRLGYSFLAVWLIGFLVFTAYPLINTIYLSFNRVSLTVFGWEMVWVGFENYITALLRNIYFTPALLAFLVMQLLFVPTIVTIAFILALLLNQKIKGRSFFRTVYFLPVIVLSGTVMTQLIESGSTDMTGVEALFIYRMIENFSVEFAQAIAVIFDSFSMILWFTGIPIVLYINGLQKINRQLFEAAQIDGATAWQILWKITLPIIRPIGLIVSIFSIVQLGTFPINPVYQMIVESMQNTTFGLGYASAYAWIYSVVVLLLIAVAFLLFRERPEKNKKRLQREHQRQLDKLRRKQKRNAPKALSQKVRKSVVIEEGTDNEK